MNDGQFEGSAPPVMKATTNETIDNSNMTDAPTPIRMPVDGASSASNLTTRRQLVLLAFGIVVIALVMLRLQYATASICCGDYDGYYHIGWSRMLWESFQQGRLPVFGALPFTTLNPQDYVDHHFLFHVLQIPFTWFGDIRAGAKISAWLFATLGVFACYWLMVKENIAYTPVWLIALLGASASFLYRINMTKAMSLSLVCLILGIYLLFRRKYVWLAPLAFIYVWLYSLWVLLPVAGAMWMGVLLWSEHRIEWKVVLWISVGVIAGMLINPYFPDNFRLLYEHIAMKAGKGEFETRVGGEWYPWDTSQFLGACAVAIIAMVVGYVAFDWTDRKRAARPLFFLCLATFLMIATMLQKRYSEYFPPFAILFAAFALQNMFDRARQGNTVNIVTLPQNVLAELQPFLDSGMTPVESGDAAQPSRDVRAEIEAAITGAALASVISLTATELPVSNTLRVALTVLACLLAVIGIGFYWFKYNRRQAVAVGLALLLGVGLFQAIRNEVREIGDSPEPDTFAGSMNWIRSNVPPGEVVFNTDWDDFPKIFFYDNTHAYVSGLDPTYLLYENPDLSKLYERITNGEEKEAAPLIREKFGARYIFTDKKPRKDGDSNDFYFNLTESGWVEEKFDDGTSTVLMIRDERGAPESGDDDAAADDEESSDDENAASENEVSQ